MTTNGEVDTGLLVPDLLDLDLSEAEDKEFNVPSAAKTKRKLAGNLLNDDESSLISEEDLPNYLPPDLVPTSYDDKGDCSSVSSVGSKSGQHTSSAQQKKVIQAASILRHVILRAVSSQLHPNIDELIIGTPSAMCVSNLIAVGTTHGVIMCFDCSQRLRWRHEAVRDQGPVTAMALNTESTRLLVGFARGMVLMLDVQDAKVLRTIPPEAHTYNTAVVHIKFTDSPSLALLSDSGGSVFEIGLKRVLGVRSWECKCIFSGSRGEVVAMEPLLLQNLAYQHPLSGFVIVAMATLSKILLVSLRPQTRLLYTQNIKGASTSLPLLSWQFVVIQVADTSRVMDPVLAVARNDTIYFYQVSLERSGKIVCQGLQSVSLPYSLISCHWLTPRTVALIDTNETLHLFDVRTKQELENLDLSIVELVYNSVAFKGLATGGNVSKAMALAGQRAVYNSIFSFGNQLLLLGVKTLHVISIRIWVERIDGLVRAQKFEDALKLAMDFYEERGKAVLGLRGAREVRQKLVKEKVIETLEKFVDHIVDGSPFINYSEAIPTVIEHCIDLDRMDLVYDKLWNGMTDGKNIYLEAIESSLIDGKITDIPPEILQRLVSYQQSMLRWEQLESCIQRVDVPCLDIEQVILICKRENLYSALISVWNRAMNDYTSPIHELVPKLRLMASEEPNVVKERRKLGNLLLVYIASCLSGAVGPDRAEHARQQVVRALCSQHSQNADDCETCFPYIRGLLEFDTREFLNSLVISFSDASLSTQIKQRLVDIIIQVMSDSPSFKCVEISWVLCVLNNSAVGRGLRVDSSLYTDTISSLVTDNSCPSADRQQAFLQLVTSGALADLDHETLLELAKSADFHQVCAILHEIRGEYSQVLKYHLEDPTRREHVFLFIEQSEHRLSMGITEEDTLKELLQIDAKQTGQLLVRYIPQAIPNILPQLSNEQLFYFLQGMLEESDLDTELMTNYVCLMCTFEPDKVYQTVKAKTNIELDPAIKVAHEKGLDEVTAILLERSGDLQAAFNVLLARLERAIENGEEDAERMTEELVSLAQRGNTVLDSKTSWLPLLMCLLKLNSHELLQRVLNNADLNLVSELHLLMQHTQGTLGELRGLIMGLFTKCRDQRRMLEATKRLHMSGLHGELVDVFTEAKVGCRSPSCCNICKDPFTDKFCLFRCGHGFHIECLPPSISKCTECFKE
ncbi:vacuolar protein sorting-associated protein 8 homolog [Cimex lectularius]|uniref:RING-type domain-containing protein n=1 Tax=Cimex lectularius TaxID=79782 RepID=A0A8I6RLG6_CIMLE|nr:vacuolar protein sorting-associated protein 8 homolog [Cimex lectularius]